MTEAVTENTLARLLTDDEWKDMTPPLNCLRVKKTFNSLELDIIMKWLKKHVTGGWYYYRTDHKMYVFGDVEDFTLFRMWIEGNPLDKDSLSI